MPSSNSEIQQALKKTGFRLQQEGSDLEWIRELKSPNETLLGRIHILERKNNFILTKCDLVFDLVKISDAIINSARAEFKKITSHTQSIEADSRMRIIVEVPPLNSVDTASANSKPRMGTCLGWTVLINTMNNGISIQFGDVFIIGDDIELWWPRILDLTTEAVMPGSSKFYELRNLFEAFVPMHSIPLIGSTKSRRPAIQTTILNEIKYHAKPTVSAANSLQAQVSLSNSEDAISTTPPIEVLESRISAATWKRIDQKMRNRKAVASLPRSKDISTCDILTRIATMPGLAKAKTMKSISIPNEIPDDSSLLSHCGAILLTDDPQMKIDRASLMFRKIAATYGKHCDLSPISKIAPEFLGDIWSQGNYQMALKSWESALRIKQNPRIENKIAIAARVNGDVGTELRIYLSLIESERRKNNIRSIADRLVEIASAENRAAIDTDAAEKIARFSNMLPSHTNLTVLAAQCLDANGRSREALHLLENRFESERGSLSGEDRSRIHAESAKIWLESEKNKEAATSKFIAAITSPSRPPVQILDAAERHFESIGRPDLLLRSLKQKIGHAGATHDAGKLEPFILQLIHQGESAEAARILADLTKLGNVDAWLISAIRSLPEDTIKSCAGLLPSIHEANTSNTDLQTAASWCELSTDLDENSTIQITRYATKLASEIESASRLPSDLSLKTMRILSKFGFTSQVVAVARQRLILNDSVETKKILQLFRDLASDDEDRFLANAFALDASKDNHIDLSLARIDFLISKKSKDSIRCMIAAHEDQLQGSLLFLAFLDAIIRMLINAKDAIFESLLSDAFIIRESYDTFSASERESFINELIGFSMISPARNILAKAIDDRDFLPISSHSAAVTLGLEPDRLGMWHYLAAARTKSIKDQRAHYRVALDLLTSTAYRPDELLEVLDFLSVNDILTIGELELFESIAIRKNVPIQFFTGLSRQILVTAGDTQPLIHWAIRFATSRLTDPSIAAKHYKSWLGGDSLMGQDYFTMAYLNYMANDVSEATRQLETILSTNLYISESGIIQSAVGLAEKLSLESILTIDRIQNLLSWTKSAGLDDTYNYVKSIATLRNALGYDDFKNYFIDEFSVLSPSKLGTVLGTVIQKGHALGVEAGTLIHQLELEFKIAGSHQKMSSVVYELMQSTVFANLSPESRNSIRFYVVGHGENQRGEQIQFESIYQSMIEDLPSDPRPWIRLYEILEVSTDTSKFVEFLKKMIISSRMYPNILQTSPFTLESLEHELANLSSPKKIGTQDEAVLISENLEEVGEDVTPVFAAAQTVNATPEITNDLPPSTTPSPTAEEPMPHWRTFNTAHLPLPGSTLRTMGSSYGSDLEKHIAVQYFALLTGEIDALDAWAHRVWRHPDSLTYTINASDRVREQPQESEKSQKIHQISRCLQPVMLKFAKHLTDTRLTGLKSRILNSPNDVAGAFSDPCMKRTYLTLFTAALNAIKTVFVDSPGLGIDVIFDPERHTIHFDANWQMQLPPAILTHRVLILLCEIQRGTFPFTSLNAANHLMPIISKVKEEIEAEGIVRLRKFFSPNESPISHMIKKVNQAEAKNIFKAIGNIDHTEIMLHQSRLRSRTLDVVLASTLDLIGLAESQLGLDLCGFNNQSILSLFENNWGAKYLLDAATKLRF